MKGLYRKYRVTKNGAEVRDCFVLRSDTDPAAVAALATYAAATPNEDLRRDLTAWLATLPAPPHPTAWTVQARPRIIARARSAAARARRVAVAVCESDGEGATTLCLIEDVADLLADLAAGGLLLAIANPAPQGNPR